MLTPTIGSNSDIFEFENILMAEVQLGQTSYRGYLSIFTLKMGKSRLPSLSHVFSNSLPESSVLSSLVLLSPVRYCMILYGPLGSLVAPFGPLWSHMVSYGQFGPLWFRIV